MLVTERPTAPRLPAQGPSEMSALSFYAELLPNIRSISLSIVPPTPPNDSTRAVVSPGANHLKLHHNNKTTTVQLPALSNPGHQEIVIAPRPGEESFSCRLPVATSPDSTAENRTPWSAPFLSQQPEISVLCGSCDNVVIASGAVKTWKDLPSDNWADMMDFWHCHKPHERSADNGSTSADSGKYSSFGKGYVLDPGTGLVDNCYFLFNKEDCANGVQTATSSSNRTILGCSRCSAPLGVPEVSKQQEQNPSTWRIHKWCIAVSIGKDTSRYPLECFLAAQFLAYVDNEGVRRLLIANGDDPNAPKLKLWIFNTDILYTHTHTKGPMRGMKVYWRHLQVGEQPPPTDRLTASGFEGVSLDDAVFNTLQKCLQDSCDAMPEDVQLIGEWKAGVLGRF